MTITQQLVGLEARPVTVRVGPGPFKVLGLPDASAREVRVRVHSALSATGRDPGGELTLDGTPGACGDLAVAVAAAGVSCGSNVVLLGELALNGDLRAVRGVYAHVLAATSRGCAVVVPPGNEREARLVEGACVAVARDVGEVLDHFTSTRHDVLAFYVQRTRIEVATADPSELPAHPAAMRLGEAIQNGATRVLVTASPSGAAVMLARQAAGMLGRFGDDEVRACTAIHSAAGLIDGDRGYVDRRPFRAPHHTVSTAGLVGNAKRPGEVSLAHNGVLLLDEATEFRRDALDALWATLKLGTVGSFPAAPRLVIARVLPCPCGYHGSPKRDCRCSERAWTAHKARVERIAVRCDEALRLTEVSVQALVGAAS